MDRIDPGLRPRLHGGLIGRSALESRRASALGGCRRSDVKEDPGRIRIGSRREAGDVIDDRPGKGRREGHPFDDHAGCGKSDHASAGHERARRRRGRGVIRARGARARARHLWCRGRIHGGRHGNTDHKLAGQAHGEGQEQQQRTDAGRARKHSGKRHNTLAPPFQAVRQFVTIGANGGGSGATSQPVTGDRRDCAGKHVDRERSGACAGEAIHWRASPARRQRSRSCNRRHAIRAR